MTSAPDHPASTDLQDSSLLYSSRNNNSSNAASVSASTLPPMLTMSHLDANVAPAGFVSSGGRHGKDEIEELLYQLQVKEKEIRLSRGGVESEINNMKRNIKKMQRDTDDLVRLQQANSLRFMNDIALMGKTVGS
jgi:hypothetical protein